MHGHDVGVWVCEGSGLSLSPCLFMQALCPYPLPRALFVKWKSAAALPKAFHKAEALPLTYSECGRIPPWPYHLHLFSPQVPIVHAFEQTSGLQDWSFAVPVIGIIVTYDQKYDRPPSALSLDRLINRSSSSKKPRGTLDWVRAQHLPYVVAALGYGDSADSMREFRGRHDLGAEIPVLPGPALADAKRRSDQGQGDQSSGTFSSMFQHRKLTLDEEYARAVLGALYQMIERRR